MSTNNTTSRRVAVIALAAVIVTAGLAACKQVAEIADTAAKTAQPIPSAEDTMTSLLQINRAMGAAMSAGEKELTINTAGISEEELQNISDNMSTFWGKPANYRITGEFKDIEGILPGRAVDIYSISNSFELSDNYYIYDFIRNGKPIPEDRPRAKQIADVLPVIAADVFPDPAATDYEKTLAAHDWLVTNLEYDVTAPAKGEENSAYGAFILNRTMCQGYAEALELLLKCYTDVEIVQIVGEAKNLGNRGFEPAETDSGATEADGAAAPEIESGEGEDEAAGETALPPVDEWNGHAWNAVKLDGDWYHVDTTFDDPIGGATGNISHFYFGQTDSVMKRNHRWAAAYFPVSNSDNFLFFRQSGLFAEDWDEFQSILTGLLEEAPVDRVEIAVIDASIDEDNIQFVYKVRMDLDMLYWSELVWEDIHIQSLELYYS